MRYIQLWPRDMHLWSHRSRQFTLWLVRNYSTWEVQPHPWRPSGPLGLKACNWVSAGINHPHTFHSTPALECCNSAWWDTLFVHSVYRRWALSLGRSRLPDIIFVCCEAQQCTKEGGEGEGGGSMEDWGWFVFNFELIAAAAKFWESPLVNLSWSNHFGWFSVCFGWPLWPWGVLYHLLGLYYIFWLAFIIYKYLQHNLASIVCPTGANNLTD